MDEPKRQPGLARRAELRRRTATQGSLRATPNPLRPASERQRAKVAGLRCLVCDGAPCDPAHLVPQALGGCAHGDCVVPLCRTHHRLYDAGELRLGLHLGNGWRAELEHALAHVDASSLERALDGRGWEAGSRGRP